MKKINRRERRESCACTGRGSGSTMQRRSIARPSRHLPPPPSRTTMAQQLRSCCILRTRTLLGCSESFCCRRCPTRRSSLNRKLRLLGISCLTAVTAFMHRPMHNCIMHTLLLLPSWRVDSTSSHKLTHRPTHINQ